ncbi:MAG: thioredoxin family protein [Flavobacteriaceae bacterium]|nr:thioredoxin family protein [Flavobacteriaceae bacterium]
MTKFGELIGVETPILINFYLAEKSNESILKTLKEVSSLIGQKARIIKIDISKNELLADALKIKGNSTFVIYKDGEMKWRQTGDTNADTLLQTLQQFI